MSSLQDEARTSRVQYWRFMWLLMQRLHMHVPPRTPTQWPLHQDHHQCTGGRHTPRMVGGEVKMHGLAWQPEGGLDLGHVLGLAELLPAVPRWEQGGCASLQDGSSELALETLKGSAVHPVPTLIGVPGPSEQDQGR